MYVKCLQLLKYSVHVALLTQEVVQALCWRAIEIFLERTISNTAKPSSNASYYTTFLTHHGSIPSKFNHSLFCYEYYATMT